MPQMTRIKLEVATIDPKSPKAVQVNRPYQNTNVLDMISRCHACCANNLITQRISPAASALSISSRFAVTRAEQINFAMKEFQKCCLIPLAFITNAADGI